MKNNYKNSFLLAILLGMLNLNITYSQVTGVGNGYTGGYIGWNAGNGINPLFFKTNAINRMKLNGNGIGAAGVLTSGFIGIGTTNPISPLHIVGNQQANAQGWRRGITLSNSTTLQWDGDFHTC